MTRLQKLTLAFALLAAFAALARALIALLSPEPEPPLPPDCVRMHGTVWCGAEVKAQLDYRFNKLDDLRRRAGAKP